MAKNTLGNILLAAFAIGLIILLAIISPWLFFLSLPLIAIARNTKKQRDYANSIYGNTAQYQKHLSKSMPLSLYNANIEKQGLYEKNIENNLSQYLDKCRETMGKHLNLQI